MAYIGAGITRFNTADDLTVTDDAEIGDNATVGGNLSVTGTTTLAGATTARLPQSHRTVPRLPGRHRSAPRAANPARMSAQRPTPQPPHAANALAPADLAPLQASLPAVGARIACSTCVTSLGRPRR